MLKWLLDTELGGIGAETADQPDTELLDAEPLHRASELTSKNKKILQNI